MIRNYIKIAFRNLYRNRSFALINIFGLSLSMSVCLLIITLIVGLSQYDRFHKNYHHIFRILSKKSNESTFWASAPMPIREILKRDYSGIREVVTLKKGFGGDASYNNTAIPLFGYYCSDELFSIFSFNLIEGDPSSALKDPFSIILTKESSEKLFGNEDPIGKVIQFSERGLVVAGIPNKNNPIHLGDFTVTGVMAIPEGKTHFEFDILASLSTLSLLELHGKENTLSTDWENMNETYHYVLLENRENETYLQSILDQMGSNRNLIDKKTAIFFQVQPLSEITPGKMYKNPISYRLPIQVIYFLAILATVIILSASFNYTNLSLAKSLSRAREVGIRKVSGAMKYQVFAQFIGESILISIISLIIAIGVLQYLQPAFNSLWFTRYIHVDMAANLNVYLLFLVFSVLIGLIAGTIPALYLSSLKPLKILKNIYGTKTFRKFTLRKSLIVVQFATSLFFIITTLLLYFQLKHLRYCDYGFNEKNIINVSLHGNKFENFADRIKNHSAIEKVSGCSMVPLTGGTSYTFVKKMNEPEDSTGMSEMYADRNFVENLELNMTAGENLPENPITQTESCFLINETGAEKLGYNNPIDVVGESFRLVGIKNPLQVVGVVKDFHYSISGQEVGPIIIRYDPEKFQYTNIRINPSGKEQALDYLERKWKEMDNDHAFEAQFMSQQLEESGAIFGDIGFILGFISILAISIACLGLLGMVMFNVETRVKEIGIRKVLGASIGNAIWVLSKGFFIMLSIAILIATPLAKTINELWLREFAVRVHFGVDILALGILIILILGLITIMSQTIKSARNNPVEALHYE